MKERNLNKYFTMKLIIAIVLALLSAVAFSTDVSVSGFSRHENITLADNTLLWSLVSILLTICYYRVFDHISTLSDAILIAVFSILFGFANVIGHSLYYLDSWDFLFGNTYQFMLGTFCALGYAGVFFAAGLTLFFLLDRSNTDDKMVSGSRVGLFFDEHPRLLCSIVIGFVLLLWLVIYYPGYTNNDLHYQLQQFYGIEPLTNSHPVLSTMIIGACMSLGKFFHSDNLGLFFYMLLQSAVFVYAFGAVCSVSRKTKTSRLIRVIILLFYAVLPVWGAYSVQAMKDGLFAGVFTLFSVRCVELYVRSNENDKTSSGVFIRLTLVAILTCLLRSAVTFIVFPSLLLLTLAVKDKKTKRKTFISALICGSVSLGFIYALLPACGVIKCNRAESLSIPFQQVARIVKDHDDRTTDEDDGITDEEKAIINEVLDYDSLSDVYLPVLSDPVKDTYKQRELDTESESVSDYMSVWMNLIKRYPSSALQATLANTFGYYSFTPSIQTSNGHTGMCFFLSDEKNDGHITTDTYTITYPKLFKPIRKLVLTASYLVDAVPGINLLYACAFYFWVVILLTLYVVKRGGFSLIGLMASSLFLQLGCLGSSVNDCFRYEAPVAAAVPVLLIAALFVSRQTRLNKETVNKLQRKR